MEPERNQNSADDNNNKNTPPKKGRGVIKALRTFEGDVGEILRSSGTVGAKIKEIENSKELREKKKEMLIERREIEAQAKEIQEKERNLNLSKPKIGMDDRSAESLAVERQKLLKQKQNLESRRGLLQEAPLNIDSVQGRKQSIDIKKVALVFVILIFFALAVSFITSIFILKPDTPAPIIENPIKKQFITYDIDVPINISDDFSELVGIFREPAKPGITTKLIPQSNAGSQITARALANIFDAPASLTSSIGNEFFLGIKGTEASKDLILILKTTQHSQTLAAAFEWETNLPRLFSVLFGEENPIPIQQNEFFRTGFVDETTDNKDFRVFIDSNNFVKVIYGFYDINTLVLSSGKSTILDVYRMLRLNEI